MSVLYGDSGRMSSRRQQRLLGRYVHSGNTVIQPLTLDKATGIVTVKDSLFAQGLKVNDVKQVIPVSKSFAGQSVPREMKATNGHYIKVLSEYTIYIMSSSSTPITSYPDSNTPTDLSQNTFETYSMTAGTGVVVLDLKPYDAREFKIVAHGVRNRPGWSYIEVMGTHDGGSFRMDFGTIIDGRDFQTIYQEVYTKLEPIQELLYMQGIRSMSKVWNDTNGTWSLSGTSEMQNRRIEKVKNFKFEGITIPFPMANGFVVEVYDLRGE